MEGRATSALRARPPESGRSRPERFFSIASAPHEEHVMLTTRFASRSSSFKKALKNLRRGDSVEAHDLEGDFVVDDICVHRWRNWHYAFPRHFARSGLKQETVESAASVR
jgi:hypothetical protein